MLAEVNVAPALHLGGRGRRRPARKIAPPKHDFSVVENTDDHRRPALQHPPRDQLVAGRAVAGLQHDQVPIAGRGVGGKPGRRQQQPARHGVGHDFAGAAAGFPRIRHPSGQTRDRPRARQFHGRRPIAAAQAAGRAATGSLPARPPRGGRPAGRIGHAPPAGRPRPGQCPVPGRRQRHPRAAPGRRRRREYFRPRGPTRRPVPRGCIRAAWQESGRPEIVYICTLYHARIGFGKGRNWRHAGNGHLPPDRQWDTMILCLPRNFLHPSKDAVPRKKPTPRRYALISLGCPKNLVDSERMAGLLQLQGYRMVAQPDGADVVVVNTCGFIADARTESYDAIEEMLRLKKRGRVGRVIVAGCLAERDKARLLEKYPEIDQSIGVFARDEIITTLGRLDRGEDQERGLFRPAPSCPFARYGPATNHAPPFGLSEDCRGLQSLVQLLLDSANARSLCEQARRASGGRGRRAGGRRSSRVGAGGPGYDLLTGWISTASRVWRSCCAGWGRFAGWLGSV